ncbi:NAD(P)H-dependent flavin oxidoreductase [Niallia sp. Krafla_26]|uniref:NAD(P)H-dependent flavin oxidoreductase n=1 Tax=Niallia sp. Krafla_26 TaxID=3064703 RepID=UPI003D17B95B
MNSVCEQLKIKYPIVQGGMGNISHATLSAAVSEAGGLGTIGCGTMKPDDVENIILETKELTCKPFAINIALSVNPYVEELVHLAIKHQVPVISLSAGNPAPFIPTLHQHGIKVIVVVASVKHAQKAEAAGADLLVAEGFEAAGINSSLELTTFTLIPQIHKAVSIPVIAAGGIGDGKGLAAAMMLGASGVQMGTRFIATKEAQLHDNYKERLLQASGTDTRIVGRTVGRVRRVLQSEYVEKIFQAEKEGISLEEFNEITSEDYHVKGAVLGDLENGYINSGQIAGLISAIPTVQELIESMMEEAKTQLEKVTQILLLQWSK